MKLKVNKHSIIIAACAIILAIFGCVMVYSASKHAAFNQYDNSFFYLKKQVIGVMLGLVGMITCYFINHRLYKRFYWVFYIVGLIFLALVFIPGLGRTSYGATRWIGLGGITIQPSEIAKFCLVFFLSGYLCDAENF